MAKKMIPIDKQLLDEILKEIPMNKGAIGEVIGLGSGGFWRVTHVSGRMNEKSWNKLKELYFKTTGKNELPQIVLEKNSDLLNSVSIESLVDELERRGWTVSLARKH